MKQLFHLILSMLALLITSYLVPGFEVESFWATLATVVVLSIVNILVKPIMMLITLPLNILTLGLFTFVINGLMLKIASSVVPGFVVIGWMPAIIGGIVLGLVSAVLFGMAGEDR
ncbi:phage holin family protein [Patescibacteria group bacterium]|nr:phage holin family protein [Patescibacteria group bacterium]